MTCAFQDEPFTGLCFNVGSECTGHIFYYETDHEVLLCPGGLACCIGGIIAGPNPILRADTYTTLGRVEFADSENEQDSDDRFDDAATVEADPFTVGMNSVLNVNPDLPLMGGARGLDLYDQAFFPSADSSSFQTSFDDIFSAPSEMDYTAFLEQGDLSGFRSASKSDQSNSIYSEVGSSNSGESDLFLKDYFST